MPGSKLAVSALIVWFLLTLAAIANGAIRELFVAPVVGEQAGHLIATGVLVLVILVAAYVLVSHAGRDHPRAALWIIGGMWLFLTLGFEFLFGHYVMGHTWARLLADYNIPAGRVWALVLLTVLFAPPLMGSFLEGRAPEAVKAEW